jgi:pimeloyl-ACP methyl ester carboxylesterase
VGPRPDCPRRARLHGAYPDVGHHELPLHEGASKIAPLSLRDYTDDLVALVASLDSPPLLVGHSLGGLVVQLVAARTHNAGMVAACPSTVGSSGLKFHDAGDFAPWAWSHDSIML